MYFLLSIFLQFVITIVKINSALWGSLETIIHSFFHAAGYKIVTELEQFFQPSSGWTFIIKEGTLYFIIFWMIAFACKAKFWCIAQPLADALMYFFSNLKFWARASYASHAPRSEYLEGGSGVYS